MQNSLLQLFPAEKRAFWSCAAAQGERLQEIRIRVDRPIVLLLGDREMFLNERGDLQSTVEHARCATGRELEELLNHLCHYSLYAFEDEFRQGFLTVSGGHRVGIAGQVVQEGDGTIRTMKNISYLNIRIAHQVKGVADGVLPYVYEAGRLKNVLIISPPGCGKTTLLRDLIRQVSDGNAYGMGRCVGVVDERSEIAGSCQGVPQNDIGMRTDVLDGCPKQQGMMLLLRSMSPQVIAIDELGGEEDMKALRMAAYCGVGILATAHGESIEDVAGRFRWENAFREGMFDLFLILGRENGRPIVRKMIKKEEFYAATVGRKYDYQRLSGAGNLVQTTIYSPAENYQDITGDTGNTHERNQLW